MNSFLFHQTPRSLPCCFIHLILCMMVIFVLDPTDGLSWIDAPDEHTCVKHGDSYAIIWNFKMEGNETFLSSEIYSSKDSLPSRSHIALRRGPKNAYTKYHMNSENTSLKVSGKNNVTLFVHVAKIGNNITYCCEVTLESVAGLTKKSCCSTIFVYELPRIILHTPKLFCRQGDSIKLKCNATGIPKPHLEWRHDENHALLKNSTDIVLNITGKRSEGRYCCGAYNGFGKEQACTAVYVTEFKPVNTTILVNLSNNDKVNVLIHIKCKARASPPSNLFIIGIDAKKYNSSNGQKTIKVPASRIRKTNNIAVSCIPSNKYGRGPFKKGVFPLYDPPRFATSLRTKYSMTGSAITLKCEAFGSPTPRITWTRGDTGNITSEGKFYQIPYVNCRTKTMTFFCHASNAVGKISSPAINVSVMAKWSNCSTGYDSLDHSVSDKNIMAIIISCTSLICILILVLITRLLFRWWKMPKPRKGTAIDNHEDLYREPLDVVFPDKSRFRAKNNTTPTDEGYASVEDFRPSCRMKPKQELRNPSTGRNIPLLGEKEKVYESIEL